MADDSDNEKFLKAFKALIAPKAPKVRRPHYLYHYTDRKGIVGLMKSGELLPSLQKIGDTTYGEGIYFTDIGPKADPKHIRINNWDGASPRFPEERVAYFVRVDRRDLPSDRLQNKSKNISTRVSSVWLLAQKEPLKLDPAKFFFGRRVANEHTPREIRSDQRAAFYENETETNDQQ